MEYRLTEGGSKGMREEKPRNDVQKAGTLSKHK